MVKENMEGIREKGSNLEESLNSSVLEGGGVSGRCLNWNLKHQLTHCARLYWNTGMIVNHYNCFFCIVS